MVDDPQDHRRDYARSFVLSALYGYEGSRRSERCPIVIGPHGGRFGAECAAKLTTRKRRGCGIARAPLVECLFAPNRRYSEPKNKSVRRTYRRPQHQPGGDRE